MRPHNILPSHLFPKWKLTVLYKPPQKLKLSYDIRPKPKYSTHKPMQLLISAFPPHRYPASQDGELLKDNPANSMLSGA